MKKVMYGFYTPKEKPPVIGKMLLLYCHSGTWIGGWNGENFFDENELEIESKDVVMWAVLKNPA